MEKWIIFNCFYQNLCSCTFLRCIFFFLHEGLNTRAAREHILCCCKKCTTTYQRQACGQNLLTNHYSKSRWKHRENRKMICQSCEETSNSWTCDLCAQKKTRVEYSSMMWMHRFYNDQRTLCLDCSRPACTSPTCKTCRSCRNETCKQLGCTEPIRPLNAKLLPQTLDDVQNFRCSNCRARCAICNRSELETSFGESAKRHR